MADRRFDTFIFDLDGTLLNTLPDLVLLTNGILDELGFPQRSQAEILGFVGNGVRRLMYQAVPEDASEEAVDEAMRLWDERFHRYYEHTHPYPGVIETLEELRRRGCKIGVVSNKLQAGVDLIIGKCMPGLVDVAFGESPLVPRKPDPTGIRTAMNWLRVEPQDVAYVGDSPGDMTAAHNAGVFAVGVTWGYNEPDDLKANANPPALMIDAPEELLALAVIADDYEA